MASPDRDLIVPAYTARGTHDFHRAVLWRGGSLLCEVVAREDGFVLNLTSSAGFQRLMCFTTRVRVLRLEAKSLPLD